MDNPGQEAFCLNYRLRHLLVLLMTLGMLSGIAAGCGSTQPVPTGPIVIEETSTSEPVPVPALSNRKEDKSPLVRALEDNTSLKLKLSALDQELQELSNNPSPLPPETFAAESELEYLRKFQLSPGARAWDTYVKFIRDEVDRLKLEVKRLEESGLAYDYAFPESGFPMNQQKDVLALAVTLRESIVFIEAKMSLGGIGRGTGFVIDDDLVITNDHVVSDAHAIVVRTFGGEDFSVNIVGTDPGWDIALLRSDRPMGAPRLTWGDSRKLTVKDGVFAIGHPGQMGDWALTGGVFVRSITDPTDIENFEEVTEGDPGTETRVETSVPSMSGSSGSPIFNMNGEVIAVLFGSTGIEDSTDIRDIGSFSNPAPHRIHSAPAVVSREWTNGSPAWKVQELIEEWLAN